MSTIPFPIKPPIIAHRGACAYAPENTLISFEKARDLNIAWVEFDVMLSSCGEAVVIHDETLDRTTNGTGHVIDHPYAYLKTLDAGSWFSPEFKHVTIPTLQQVIDFLDINQMSANIELKPQLGFEEQTVTKVLDVLKKYWKNDKSPPLLSSFSLPTLEFLRKKSQSAWLGFLMDDWLDHWAQAIELLQCVSLNVNHDTLTLDRIQKIKSMNYWLMTYTVNDSQQAKNLFKAGVDAVFSDNPDKILRSLFIKKEM